MIRYLQDTPGWLDVFREAVRLAKTRPDSPAKSMDFSGAMITTYRSVGLSELDEPGSIIWIVGHVISVSGILQESEMIWTL